MALFGKKKNSGTGEVPEANMEAQIPKKGKAAKPSKQKKAKGKKNGMAAVLNESVPGTVSDQLRMNEPFIHHSKNGDRYVGMLFNVLDIGGLDKKSRKVEAKGSLIEAINSGNLLTVITSELMDRDELVFIPDSRTLCNMLDYSLLDRSPETGEQILYKLVYINADGASDTITVEPVMPETKVTFSDIADHVGNNEGTVDDLLETEEEPYGGDMFEDDSMGNGMDDSLGNVSADNGSDNGFGGMDQGSGFDDSIPALDDVPAYDNGAGGFDDGFDNGIPAYDDNIDDIDDIGHGTGLDEGFGAPAQDGYQVDIGKSDEAPAQEEEAYEQQEEEVPDEWMSQTMVRKFYSDDLGLEITTEPFDVQFVQNNFFVPFDEARPSGWLNDQLNEMSRQANAEMDRIHKENLFLMRERYFKLMSRHADRIQHDLSIVDDRTQYGRIMMQLRRARDEEYSRVDARVARKKEDIEAAWKRKLQEVGQDAARAAQSQYRQRYGKQHENDIYNLEDEIKASIEDDYQDAVHEVHDRRRDEASRLLDLGITEVLEEISDMYTVVLADENAQYAEFAAQQQAFADDNRRHDISRTDALAEELRQKDKADAVLAEQTEKIRNLQIGFEGEKAKLQQEIQKLRQDNEARLAELRSRSDDDLSRERKHSEELQAQLDNLRERNEKIYEDARQEYAHQLAEKDNEVQALHDRLGEAAHQQKNHMRLATYLVVAISLLALGIGFIGGTYMRLQQEIKSSQQQMIQEYDQAQQKGVSHSADTVDKD